MDENTEAECSNENNQNSVCKFSCADGYTLSHDEIYCKDGAWSRNQLKCQAILAEAAISMQPEISVQEEISVPETEMTIHAENNVSKTALRSACPALMTGILSLQDSIENFLNRKNNGDYFCLPFCPGVNLRHFPEFNSDINNHININIILNDFFILHKVYKCLFQGL